MLSPQLKALGNVVVPLAGNGPVPPPVLGFEPISATATGPACSHTSVAPSAVQVTVMLPFARPVVLPPQDEVAASVAIWAGTVLLGDGAGELTAVVLGVGEAPLDEDPGGEDSVGGVAVGGRDALVAALTDTVPADTVPAEAGLDGVDGEGDTGWRLIPTGSPEPAVEPLQAAAPSRTARKAASTRRFIQTSAVTRSRLRAAR